MNALQRNLSVFTAIFFLGGGGKSYGQATMDNPNVFVFVV